MPRLYLVRHGRASAGWEEADPPLDEVGRAQARALADRLAPLGPLPLVTSPLRRTRETAVPLGARWGVVAAVEPAVAELPSPEGVPDDARVAWLRGVLGGTWSELGARYERYRASVLDRLASYPDDTVVVSHFVAINAAVGAALGDDRLVVLHLDNCSVTTVDVAGGTFTLAEGGAEDPTTLIR